MPVVEVRSDWADVGHKGDSPEPVGVVPAGDMQVTRVHRPERSDVTFQRRVHDNRVKTVALHLDELYLTAVGMELHPGDIVNGVLEDDVLVPGDQVGQH